MLKRGQVSFFIIIGILVLAVFLSFFLLRGYFALSNMEIESQSAQKMLSFAIPVQDYVEACLRRAGESALSYVSEHGGYYILPPLSQEKLGLPYYLFENHSYFPSSKEVENQLGLYVDHELGFCLQNFDYFVKQGYVILSGSISTTVSLSFNSVRFDLAFPITVQKDSSLKSLDSFSTLIPSRFYVLYNAASAYMDEQAQFPQRVCLSCLHSLMGEQNMSAELKLVNDSEEKIVFVITDQQSSLIYQFLNEYDFQEAGSDLADYENLSEFVEEDFEEGASNDGQ